MYVSLIYRVEIIFIAKGSERGNVLIFSPSIVVFTFQRVFPEKERARKSEKEKKSILTEVPNVRCTLSSSVIFMLKIITCYVTVLYLKRVSVLCSLTRILREIIYVTPA